MRRRPASETTNSSVPPFERKLNRELRRLQEKLGFGYELKQVKWIPGGDSKVSGRVMDDIVYIYDAEPEKALETLKHEVLDYFLTSRIITPMTDLINLLVRDKAERAYSEKERLVEAFARLL